VRLILSIALHGLTDGVWPVLCLRAISSIVVCAKSARCLRDRVDRGQTQVDAGVTAGDRAGTIGRTLPGRKMEREAKTLSSLFVAFILQSTLRGSPHLAEEYNFPSASR